MNRPIYSGRRFIGLASQWTVAIELFLFPRWLHQSRLSVQPAHSKCRRSINMCTVALLNEFFAFWSRVNDEVLPISAVPEFAGKTGVCLRVELLDAFADLLNGRGRRKF